jgi:hypothetical protein
VTSLSRSVAVVAFVAAAATAAASPGPAEAAERCEGVRVVVDATALGGSITSRCAPGDPASGFAALQAVGHTYTFVPNIPGFVCTLDSRPNPCNGAPSDAYWSYWSASSGGSWVYNTRGAGSRDPAPGDVEGWAFGAGSPPALAPPPNPPPPRPEPEPEPEPEPRPAPSAPTTGSGTGSTTAGSGTTTGSASSTSSGSASSRSAGPAPGSDEPASDAPDAPEPEARTTAEQDGSATPGSEDVEDPAPPAAAADPTDEPRDDTVALEVPSGGRAGSGPLVAAALVTAIAGGAFVLRRRGA